MKRLVLMLMLSLVVAPLAGCVVYPAHPAYGQHWVRGHYNAQGYWVPGHYN